MWERMRGEDTTSILGNMSKVAEGRKYNNIERTFDQIATMTAHIILLLKQSDLKPTEVGISCIAPSSMPMFLPHVAKNINCTVARSVFISAVFIPCPAKR